MPPVLSLCVLLLLLAGCSESWAPSPDAGVRPDGPLLPDARADRGAGEAGADAADLGPVDRGPGGDLPDADGGGPGPTCVAAVPSGSSGPASLSDGTDTAKVTVTGGSGCARTFSIATTATLKDNLPQNPRTVIEQPGWPSVQTHSPLFDALYALALEEVRQCSVSSIKDGAFGNGQAIACPAGGCFETGRKWTYVWTRDTAYAVDLGLAALDPTRAKNSMEFKLSARRDGTDTQIVQDTGTGGSYPVSTDRVTWALGAMTLLGHLSGAARTAFAKTAFEAIRNTVEHDRLVVYDAQTGLYRGESSFLDWREQTYPHWTAKDTVHIGMSRGLSTNVAHVAALGAAAVLGAEAGHSKASTYASWRDALKKAIRDRLYLPSKKQFSAFITTELDPAPVQRYDLLGSALAVVHGVATPAQAADLVATYPHLPAGPPVIWPQQQGVPIYHNRAIWPFVTAYWLLAAAKVGNDRVVDRAVDSLMRGAALNLSNMENLEAETGRAYRSDGALSGPVVNSQRQLWSVAGYLAMVHRVVFGIDVGLKGIRFSPVITSAFRASTLAGASSVVLNDFPYQGKLLTVVVQLPKASAAPAGVLEVAGVKVGGVAQGAGYLDASKLAARTRVDVVLKDPASAKSGAVTAYTSVPQKTYYGPKTPSVTSVTASGGQLTVSFSGGGESASDITFNVYRDGTRVAAGLSGSSTSWTDTAPGTGSGGTVPSRCYAVESVYVASGAASQHAAPSCYWGPSYDRATSLWPSSFQATGGTYVNNHGRYHYENWGDSGHKLVVPSFVPQHTGEHLLTVEAGNAAGPVSTGITCAVKLLTVHEAGSGTQVAGGYLMMPHLPAWTTWEDASFVRAKLTAGKTYRITVASDAKAENMSVRSHFATYTGGKGGASGAYNRVNIAQIKVLWLGR